MLPPDSGIARSLRSAGRELVVEARRLGYRWYHAARAVNYTAELYAPPVATPGGTIRTYEPVDSHSGDTLLGLLAENAGPEEVIYDVGAYVGEYALALAADRPGRTVVAFEPDPENCARLRQNLERTAPAGNVELREVGLGESDDECEFHRSAFPKLSSFDRADATRWGARVTGSESVPIRALDSLRGELPPPDHVKIDVEGHAPAVLRGASRTLSDHRPVLYVEPHDRPSTDRRGAVREWCRDHDYAVVQRGDVLVCCPPGTAIGDLSVRV